MGGADRNEKRRRQEAASRRLAAAGIEVPKKRTSPALIIVVAVLVVAVLVGGVLFYLRRTQTTTVAPTYTATAAAAVVTAGTGKPTIDVYEDFLCPNCEAFEKAYGNEIVTALNEGKLTVRFHTVAILDKRTTPPGYSTRAANAALCSVAAAIYPTYHAKLFAEQPSEGSAGLTDDQLVAFGTQLGAKGDFAGCVKGATNAAAVAAETQKAATDPVTTQGDGTFGTPTVVANGAKVDLNNSDWLKEVLAKG